MNRLLFTALLIPFLSFSNNVLSIVDPIKNPIENSNKRLRDTTTIELKTGTISIGRDCSDKENSSWTNSSLNISAIMAAEAAQKNVMQDLVWVELKPDEYCNFNRFSIQESGELESLNTLVKNFCSELIFTLDSENLKNPFGCPSDACENILFPISVNFY